jgi:uncharacterized protein YigE (DUF2233 family)
MKKLKFIAPIIILFIAIGFWFVSSLKEKQTVSEAPQVLGETEINQPKTISAWFKVPNSDQIILYPNYEEKLTAETAKEKYNCSSIVSAGFYSTDSKPLGLVVSEKKTVAGFRKSDFFNAVYSINDFSTPRITPDIPRDELRLALQSGPMLIENGTIQKLQLTHDKEARRLVVATTGDNQTIFIVFYNPASVYIGPQLVDLPDELKQFQTENNIQIADAMNLDGGTASVFNNGDLNLPEASLSGSFFCILPGKT